VLTLVWALLSVRLVLPLSPTVAALFAAILGFVTFGAPAVLVWAQKFKKSVLPVVKMSTH
jgi:phosphatidylinositol glycan class C protein